MSGDTGGWPRHIAVLGAAGLIGSGVTSRLAVDGIGETVSMIDVREQLLRAHAIDIAEAQVIAGTATTALRVASTAEAGAADLVIVAASVPETPDGDRRKLLTANLRLLRILADDIVALAGETGVVMLLSNPVDILSASLHRITKLEPERIIGYSLNDSIRFRMAIGREIGVHPSRLEAWVLGEHGSGQVPLFSRILLDRKPLVLDQSTRTLAKADADGWFARWSALNPGRSSGWTTPLGVIEAIKAMAAGTVLPSSVWTGGVSWLNDAFITLPATLGPDHTVQVANWNLDQTETTGIQHAVESVRTATEDGLTTPH